MRLNERTQNVNTASLLQLGAILVIGYVGFQLLNLK